MLEWSWRVEEKEVCILWHFSGERKIANGLQALAVARLWMSRWKSLARVDTLPVRGHLGTQFYDSRRASRMDAVLTGQNFIVALLVASRAASNKSNAS